MMKVYEEENSALDMNVIEALPCQLLFNSYLKGNEIS